MKSFKIVSVFAFLLILGMSAQAQVSTLKNNRHRIANGVRSGELTRREAKTLVNNQKEIREDKREARADGVVTPGERHEINAEKREQSAAIYRKKHNNRTR